MIDNLNGFDFIDFDPADYAEEIAAANQGKDPALLSCAKQDEVKQEVILNNFCGYDLPAGVDLAGVDLENPAGLAGQIVDLMRTGAHREVKGGAYALMALQIMAATAGKIRGYGRSKLSLVTITLGVSAAGKERPQSVAKKLLDDVGVIVSGDIRSDKDILRTVIARDARCIYIVDEAQKLLTSDEKTETAATKNIQNTLLELITSDNFKLSEMHKAEFSEKYYNQLAKLEKELSAKEDAIASCNPIYDAEKKIFLEKSKGEILEKIEGAKEKINTIQIGIRDASVNLSAFSTPIKLADFIDEKAIESGFLGRGLIADCGVDAERLNLALLNDVDNVIGARLASMHADIVEKLKAIFALSQEGAQDRVDAEFNGAIFTAEGDAAQLMREIALFYDERDDYRNHPHMGPLMRRLYERLCSISSILALDSVPFEGRAIVKKEHVLYSLAVILASAAMLEANLKINEGATSEFIQDKIKSFEALIIKQLNKKEFKYKSIVKNKAARGKAYKKIEEALKGTGQDAFENAIAKLAAGGVITISQCNKKIMLKK